MAPGPTEVVVAIDTEDVLAGLLFSHRKGGRESASFSYAPEYLTRFDAYALDPSLPLVQGGLPTPEGLSMFRAFTDAAPDRWGRNLIMREERRRATAQGGTARSLGEIDFVLGVRDDFRQGALRFRDQETGVFLANEHSNVPRVTNIGTLLQAAEHLESDEETEEELRDLLRGGSSLGGARPKAHVIDSKGKIAIAKFPSSKFDSWDVTAWESVALHLAHLAGILVSKWELLRVADRSVLVVDRFDRDGYRRIGYMSAMTMLEARDGDIGSYLDIASAIEEVSPRASDDLHELWRRMAFTILISNTDDHLRNHAFLHVGGNSWTLSPAFDVNPNPLAGPKQLATAIDETDTTASVDTLMSVAPFFRLDEEKCVDVLREVLVATSSWREAAARGKIPRAEIEEMAPAFEHAEREAARAITGI